MIDQFETLGKFVTRSLNCSLNDPTIFYGKMYKKMRDGQGMKEGEWQLKGEWCGVGWKEGKITRVKSQHEPRFNTMPFENGGKSEIEA